MDFKRNKVVVIGSLAADNMRHYASVCV